MVDALDNGGQATAAGSTPPNGSAIDERKSSTRAVCAHAVCLTSSTAQLTLL